MLFELEILTKLLQALKYRSVTDIVKKYFKACYCNMFSSIIMSIPSSLSWYHGKLDRKTSEERLQKQGQPGSYLVRESERKHSQYSLSYLGISGISHFSVTSVCGDYYIGGRQFDSLRELIGYYTKYSCLLKDEKLEHPVRPPKPVSIRNRVIAKYSYKKRPDTEELRYSIDEQYFDVQIML